MYESLRPESMRTYTCNRTLRLDSSPANARRLALVIALATIVIIIYA